MHAYIQQEGCYFTHIFFRAGYFLINLVDISVSKGACCQILIAIIRPIGRVGQVVLTADSESHIQVSSVQMKIFALEYQIIGGGDNNQGDGKFCKIDNRGVGIKG